MTNAVIEPKYLLFDAMLAVNELLWVIHVSPTDLILFKLSKDLDSLYLALDIFQTLVYSNNSGALLSNSVIKAYHKNVAPLLNDVLTQVVEIGRFKPHSISIAQLKSVEAMMHDK